VRGTADAYLIAFDAKTGAVRWEQSIADPAKGYSFTMPPLIYDDLVLVGTAGAELGIKRWIGAFRLVDGSSVWKFKTVPDLDDRRKDLGPEANDPGIDLDSACSGRETRACFRPHREPDTERLR